jgi:hypothetical protein
MIKGNVRSRELFRGDRTRLMEYAPLTRILLKLVEWVDSLSIGSGDDRNQIELVRKSFDGLMPVRRKPEELFY